jgi:hypothetical protein
VSRFNAIMATLQDLINMDLEKEGVSKIIAEYVWYVLMPLKLNSILMPVPALFF